MFSNRPLAATVALTVLLQLGAVYLPFANRVFKTQPLSAGELAAAVAVASVVFWAVEGEKWLRRRRRARNPARTAGRPLAA